MSEFSPDTIQFDESTEAPAGQSQTRVVQSNLYQELNHWLAQTQHPIWQHWLHLQTQEAALGCFLKALQYPLHLSTLPRQLRDLHAQIMPTMPHAETLRQLLQNWQKQTEALTLNNRAAYEKTCEERENLNSHLADTGWPAAFIQHCSEIEAFLNQQAETRFTLPSRPLSLKQASLPPAIPQESTQLKQTSSGFLLPSQLKASIFQRSSAAWVRRAARYLQIAWQDNFNNKNSLKKLLKSLYAALEQEPNNGPALLLLGWVFAGMENRTAAMACLERLRQHEEHAEMIFLIRFLQNRPVL